MHNARQYTMHLRCRTGAAHHSLFRGAQVLRMHLITSMTAIVMFMTMIVMIVIAMTMIVLTMIMIMIVMIMIVMMMMIIIIVMVYARDD